MIGMSFLGAYMSVASESIHVQAVRVRVVRQACPDGERGVTSQRASFESYGDIGNTSSEKSHK